MAGTVSGGFNSKKKSWQKAKKQKEREVRKRKGVAAKHKVTAVAGVSGKHTKKHQRKVEKAKKLAAKKQEALDSVMQVEGTAPAGNKGKKKRCGPRQAKLKQRAAAAAAARAAAAGAAAPQAMQE